MASFIQTKFAAISFAGAGYLFKLMDKNGYEEEIKRHSKALEELAKTKEQSYENEVRRHDRIQQLRQQLSDANSDINVTNKDLNELKQIQSREYNEPKLGDYYNPSGERKEYQYVTIGVLGAFGGYIIYYLKK